MSSALFENNKTTLFSNMNIIRQTVKSGPRALCNQGVQRIHYYYIQNIKPNHQVRNHIGIYIVIPSTPRSYNTVLYASDYAPYIYIPNNRNIINDINGHIMCTYIIQAMQYKWPYYNMIPQCAYNILYTVPFLRRQMTVLHPTTVRHTPAANEYFSGKVYSFLPPSPGHTELQMIPRNNETRSLGRDRE